MPFSAGNSSRHPALFEVCLGASSSLYNAIAFMLVNVPFILPLCLYILHLGAQQWRSTAKISHTNYFTYNIVVAQLVDIVGFCIITTNTTIKSKILLDISISLYLISSSAIIAFQILVCFDRYLAVVHPVIYLRLKSQTWALVRNIGCVVLWLHCLIETLALVLWTNKESYLLVAGVSFSFALLLVLFCSLSVLCVLRRPGPGEGNKGSQAKQRALVTVTAITVTLLIKFVGDLLSLTVSMSSIRDKNVSCAFFLSSAWFTLPSTLCLPLLFLHRKDKMPCFKTNE